MTCGQSDVGLHRDPHTAQLLKKPYEFTIPLDARGTKQKVSGRIRVMRDSERSGLQTSVKKPVCGGECQADFCDAGAKAKQRESWSAPPVPTWAMSGLLPKLCVSHYGLGSDKDSVTLGSRERLEKQLPCKGHCVVQML